MPGSHAGLTGLTGLTGLIVSSVSPVSLPVSSVQAMRPLLFTCRSHGLTGLTAFFVCEMGFLCAKMLETGETNSLWVNCLRPAVRPANWQ